MPLLVFHSQTTCSGFAPSSPGSFNTNTSIRLGLVKLVLATSAVRSDSSSSLLIPEIRQQRLAGHRHASHIHPVPWYTQTGGGAAGPASPAHSLLYHVHPPDSVSRLRGGAQQFHYLT